LFHRAIAQSGSTGCPWALQKSVGEYTRIIAKDLNCPTSNSRELLDCMRKTEAEKIMESRKKLMIPIVCKNYILIQNIVGIEIFDYLKIFSKKGLGFVPRCIWATHRFRATFSVPSGQPTITCAT
jgi:carboxylesterase type B